MADLKISLLKTLKHEGGYVNLPSDTGGETNFGITKRTAISAGYTGSMKELTLERACEIYKLLYWDRIKAENISNQNIADELFDTFVNCGIRLTVIFLQKAYNKFSKGSSLVVDEIIGIKTVEAINSYKKPERLEKAMNAEQCKHYCELAEKNEQFEEFYFGWLDNRVAI